MQKLVDEQLLAGRFEKITMMDLRDRPGEVFTAIELGKTFVVTRWGKDIAVLSKVPGVQLTMNVDTNGDVTYGDIETT